MSKKIIKLGNYRGKGSKIFSGRPDGERARKDSRLDKYDIEDVKFIIEIPEDTISLNSSFFLQMFGKSVRRLGETEFRAKYEFVTEDKFILASIDDGIKRALKTKSVLG
ncbi:MAG: hypothetical protein ACLKAO_13045 [Alkaliphilus sp.]